MNVPGPFTLDGPDIALALPGGEVRFTTARSGDLAAGDLTPPPAADALAARIGIPWARWLQDLQVHRPDVRTTATEDEIAPWTGEFDGQATCLEDAACVVRVADCLPIALVAPEAVAVLHGGWRPLAGDVVAHGVDALRALGATEIAAAIGPGARVCCFEAGEEVHAAFAHLGPGMRVGRHADLPAIARAQLAAAGVAAVHDVGICTICSQPDELYSHRRDGGVSGRQVGVAWRS